MVVFGILSFVNSNKSLAEQYKHESEAVLNQTSVAFEYEFSNVEKILEQLSKSSVLQNADKSNKDDINKLLQLYQELSLTNGAIFYSVENGELYHGRDVIVPQGYNPVEQNWYHLSNNSLNKIVWTEPYVDTVSQDVIISALKTVKSVKGIQGVLVINFSLSELSKKIGHSKIGHDGLVMLLSNTGIILASRDREMIGKPLFNRPFKQMIKKTNSLYEPMDINDNRYLVHSKTITQNGMSIATAISKKEIAYTLLNNHLPIFLVGFWFVLLFSIVAYVAILRGVEPLHRLGQLMNLVENGNYDVYAKINEYKEVNRLAKGFNNMIQAIKKRDEKLNVSNEELKSAEERLRYKYGELKQSQKTLQASEEKILRLASYDSLTDLLNKRSLIEVLTKSLENANNDKLKAIIFIDLDNFKMINDSLGHSFGDKLIIEVANKLKLLPIVNKDVARISGDEFILVMHDLESVKQIEDLAHILVGLFDVPTKVESRNLNVTASIGIAIYPNHADTVEELLKIADMAMYRAKETGKNGYRIFDEGIKQDIEEKLKIEQGIRQSLANNQFELFYQPLYSTKADRIVSVEALLRTNAPALAGYNILQIIQLAEVSGLIVDIDRWVLKEACMTIQKINTNLEKPIHISVNISAIHIAQQDFVETVKHIIVDSGVPVEWVKLEITETSLMESFHANKQKLYELQQMGIDFHLDDFGTGYSSLNYLKTLPIKHVKIDKSFVDVMLQSEKDSKIIETIIQLAHNIGLRVVAEGVEDQNQFDTLLNYQCELIQGYFISKPLNYEDIVKKVQHDHQANLVSIG